MVFSARCDRGWRKRKTKTMSVPPATLWNGIVSPTVWLNCFSWFYRVSTDRGKTFSRSANGIDIGIDSHIVTSRFSTRNGYERETPWDFKLAMRCAQLTRSPTNWNRPARTRAAVNPVTALIWFRQIKENKSRRSYGTRLLYTQRFNRVAIKWSDVHGVVVGQLINLPRPLNITLRRGVR